MSLGAAIKLAKLLRLMYEKGELQSLNDVKFILACTGADKILREAIVQEGSGNG